MLSLLLACAIRCDEGDVRADGECVPFPEEDPVPFVGWTPPPGLSWQIQYTGVIDVSAPYDLYDLDLFDTSDADLSDVRGWLLCYFSAGSYEDWRADADDFPDDVLGEPLDGWEGEWWLDITRSEVRTIMERRMDLAVERGCRAVDPDNVNGWENPTGFDLTPDEQLVYNRFLADAAHSRGLSIALKNDQLQLDGLADWYDLAVNEECATYDECGAYDTFVASEKPVLHIEYVDDWADAEARAAEVCDVGLDTLIKTWALGPERQTCGAR